MWANLAVLSRLSYFGSILFNVSTLARAWDVLLYSLLELWFTHLFTKFWCLYRANSRVVWFQIFIKNLQSLIFSRSRNWLNPFIRQIFITTSQWKPFFCVLLIELGTFRIILARTRNIFLYLKTRIIFYNFSSRRDSYAFLFIRCIKFAFNLIMPRRRLFEILLRQIHFISITKRSRS